MSVSLAFNWACSRKRAASSAVAGVVKAYRPTAAGGAAGAAGATGVAGAIGVTPAAGAAGVGPVDDPPPPQAASNAAEPNAANGVADAAVGGAVDAAAEAAFDAAATGALVWLWLPRGSLVVADVRAWVAIGGASSSEVMGSFF